MFVKGTTISKEILWSGGFLFFKTFAAFQSLFICPFTPTIYPHYLFVPGPGGTPSQLVGTPSQVWMVGGNWNTPRTRYGWGGYLEYPPDQVWMGYPPNLVWMVEGTQGTPPTRSGWSTPPTWSGWWGYPGYPLDQVWIRQSSIASTCYAAGSVPLAFTQEDLLVTHGFQKIYKIYTTGLFGTGTRLEKCSSSHKHSYSGFSERKYIICVTFTLSASCSFNQLQLATL